MCSSRSQSASKPRHPNDSTRTCHRSMPVRPVAALPASTAASGRKPPPAAWDASRATAAQPESAATRPGSAGAGEIFSMGVICRSGSAWKWWRMVENSGECCRVRRRIPHKHSITTATFAPSHSLQTQCGCAQSRPYSLTIYGVGPARVRCGHGDSLNGPGSDGAGGG